MKRPQRLLINSVIFLLTAGIISVSLYNNIINYNLFSTDDGNKLSYSIFADGSSSEKVKESYIRPHYIAADGTAIKNFSISTDRASIDDLYSFLSPYLYTILKDSTVSASSSGYELWETTAKNEENIVYLSFHSDIPSAVLLSHLSKEKESLESLTQNSINISELMLVLYGESNGSYSFYALTRSENGAVHTLMPKNGYYQEGTRRLLFDAAAFSTLSNSTMSAPFVFTCESYLSAVTSAKRISPTLPLQSTSISTQRLSFLDITPTHLNESASSVLGIPTSAGRYTDENGNFITVDTRGTFSINGDSFSFNSSLDGGIKLSDYLPSSYKIINKADLYTAILASENLLSSLSAAQSEFFGGDAYPLFHSCSYEDGILTVRFSFFYSNISILTSGDKMPVFSVSIRDDRIISISSKLFSVNAEPYRTKNFLPKTMLEIFSNIDAPKEYFRLKLAYREENADGSTEWIVEHK